MTDQDLLHLLSQPLAETDPACDPLIRFEEGRQAEKLIMIPSESLTPLAVRQALGSAFTSIYAEGYPPAWMLEEDADLSDTAYQLAMLRRYGDRRHYRGCEWADLVEALAIQRVRRLFAPGIGGAGFQPAMHRMESCATVFANVQPLSGAAANNAVYSALLEPGDTLLGMDLAHGGHLTHGSPYNRSGKLFKAVFYQVDLETGRLDYDRIAEQAAQVRPRMIVAGASAYPWAIDWVRLREAADSVGAYLFADIAHPAGLVAAGLFPNPVGVADVVAFTTHKTMLGPRGAVILCTDPEIAASIDRAVFPGEQGGPHLNNIAAMAVSFAIASTERFRQIQQQTVANIRRLADGLTSLGMKLAYRGSETHMLLVDLNALPASHGTGGACPLKGEVASRILDLAGIVCNKNTIPGDTTAASSSGLRFGTTWLTQRGFAEPEMDRLAELIHRLLTGVRPFCYFTPAGPVGRGKLELELLREVRQGCGEVGQVKGESGEVKGEDRLSPLASHLSIRGPRAGLFLQEAVTGDVLSLKDGESLSTALLEPDGQEICRAAISRQAEGRFLLACPPEKRERVREWLEALSDGYVIFDRQDPFGKLDGPVVVERLAAREERGEHREAKGEDHLSPLASHLSPSPAIWKPYFVGQASFPAGDPLPEFEWEAPEIPERRSCLYQEHLKLGAVTTSFAGWKMPVRYTSIAEEHRAVRERAALFDVSHMGTIEVRGSGAARFLDLVTTNYVTGLPPGEAHYAFLLTPDGLPMDDLMVYRLGSDRIMLVVNAANAERALAWLEAVNSRQWLIDRARPDRTVDVTPRLRSLSDPSCGSDGRVGMAIQGPNSLAALLRLAEGEMPRRLARLGKLKVVEGELAGLPAMVARTGYTGEEYGYEVFVHPDQAPLAWGRLMEQQDLGVTPAGLGARDSARIEAGLPLFGHELAGEPEITPGEAGYGPFVKWHKTFFIGRSALAERDAASRRQVIRFELEAPEGRLARAGHPLVDYRGRVIGKITSVIAINARQVGMALVGREHASEGTRIGALALPPRAPQAEQAVSPTPGRVVARFPKRMAVEVE